MVLDVDVGMPWAPSLRRFFCFEIPFLEGWGILKCVWLCVFVCVCVCVCVCVSVYGCFCWGGRRQ